MGKRMGDAPCLLDVSAKCTGVKLPDAPLPELRHVLGPLQHVQIEMLMLFVYT